MRRKIFWILVVFVQKLMILCEIYPGVKKSKTMEECQKNTKNSPSSSLLFLFPPPPSPSPFWGSIWGSTLLVKYYLGGSALSAKYCRQDLKYCQGSGIHGMDMSGRSVVTGMRIALTSGDRSPDHVGGVLDHVGRW